MPQADALRRSRVIPRDFAATTSMPSTIGLDDRARHASRISGLVRGLFVSAILIGLLAMLPPASVPGASRRSPRRTSR
jgi:hypothetical protein